MAAIANAVRKVFRRNKAPPLVCSVQLGLDEDPNHVHDNTCFVSFDPLAVVELFQSQGCQSCPPAVPNIQKQANHPNLAFLTYNLTLFDHLGWKDTLANPQWDNRQRQYIKRWARNSLYTPMVVVDGLADGPGIGAGQEVNDIVSRARAQSASRGFIIYLDANDTDIRIDSDRQEIEPHDIIVAVFDRTEQKIKMSKGPNKGKKLVHQNVVTQLAKIGEWRGGTVVVPLPMPASAMAPNTGAVVFVQSPAGGPIVASARVN